MARPKKRRRQQAQRLHRAAIVREVARILEAGRPTLFRYESSCRHGLRAALCLQGWQWQAADDRAALIVRLALARVGATLRPTWSIGQPLAVEREFYSCAGCGGYMSGGNARPWCSEECRVLLRQRQHRSAKRHDDMVHEKARRILLTGGAEQPATRRERRCKGCEKVFVVNYSNPRTMYCSHRCWTTADRRHPRECAVCAAPFMSKGPALYCGPACINEAGRRSRRAAAARRRDMAMAA